MDFSYNDSKYNVVTPLIKFKHSDLNMEVDLISTIHIGSLKYYEDILNQARNADVVIYEGVDDRKYKHSFVDKLHFNIFSKDVDIYRKNLVDKLNERHANFKNDLIKEQYKMNESDLLEISKQCVIVNQENCIEGNLPNWYCADISINEMNAQRKFSLKNMFKSFALKVYMHYFNDDEDFLNSTIDGFVNNPIQGKKSEKISDGITTDSDDFRESKIYDLLEEFEKISDINKVAIVYGAGHTPNIESDLHKRNYQIEDVKFLNAFKRINSQGKLLSN
jgi:hypothetical protein